MRQLDLFAHPTEPLFELPVPIRDADDAVILGTALAANADLLVTGDKDLLILAGDERLGRLTIIPPAQFLDMLAASAS